MMPLNIKTKSMSCLVATLILVMIHASSPLNFLLVYGDTNAKQQHVNYNDDKIQSKEYNNFIMYKEGTNDFKYCINNAQHSGQIEGKSIEKCEEKAYGFTLDYDKIDIDEFKDTPYWSNGGNDFKECIEHADKTINIAGYEVEECLDNDYDI